MVMDTVSGETDVPIKWEEVHNKCSCFFGEDADGNSKVMLGESQCMKLLL